MLEGLNEFAQQFAVDDHARIQRNYRDLAHIKATTRHLHGFHAPAVRKDRKDALAYSYTHLLLGFTCDLDSTIWTIWIGGVDR